MATKPESPCPPFEVVTEPERLPERRQRRPQAYRSKYDPIWVALEGLAPGHGLRVACRSGAEACSVQTAAKGPRRPSFDFYTARRGSVVWIVRDRRDPRVLELANGSTVTMTGEPNCFSFPDVDGLAPGVTREEFVGTYWRSVKADVMVLAGKVDAELVETFLLTRTPQGREAMRRRFARAADKLADAVAGGYPGAESRRATDDAE